jgi:hypothetical protein
MTDREKVNRLYEGAVLNDTFIMAVKNADNDVVKPTSDILLQHIIASIYYGWLVSKYGNTWKQYV